MPSYCTTLSAVWVPKLLIEKAFVVSTFVFRVNTFPVKTMLATVRFDRVVMPLVAVKDPFRTADPLTVRPDLTVRVWVDVSPKTFELPSTLLVNTINV